MHYCPSETSERRRRHPLRWPLLAGLVGLALLVVALVGWLNRDRPTGLPSPIAAGTATALANPAVPPGAAITSAAPGGATEASSPPAQLQIPTLKIDAPVVPVGVEATGEMAIPQDIHTLGWYEYGPSPGASAGSIVVVGHVDSATQGLGTFFYLRTITAGTTITIITADGQQRQYQVVGLQAYPKTSIPLADLFSTAGAARLTLITCGGQFDEATRSYTDNIVVTALPL